MKKLISNGYTSRPKYYSANMLSCHPRKSACLGLGLMCLDFRGCPAIAVQTKSIQRNLDTQSRELRKNFFQGLKILT